MSTQQAYPELRHGDAGEWVTYVQEQLAALGYDPGSIDGEFGPRTDAAVRQLQASAGLSEMGVVDDNTWALLGGQAPAGGGAEPEPEHYGPSPEAGPHHVAVSLGDGVQTIEAMGEAYNVRRGKIDGTSGSARFDGAGRVPGLQY